MPPAPLNGNRDVDVADELLDFLASGLSMAPGSNIFLGTLPEPGINGEVPLSGLYIQELPGPAPDMYIDTETHLFDIWTSNTDSQAGKVLLRRVYDILERKGNYALTNWYIYFSYANSTIRDEGRGREGNKLFSLSVTLICRNLNNIS
jgi:hypothetical protein